MVGAKATPTSCLEAPPSTIARHSGSGGSAMRSGLLTQSTLPPASSTSMNRSPGDGQVVDRFRVISALQRKRLRQATDRAVRTQREHSLNLIAGVPPFVLALETKAKALAAAAQGRQDRFPGHRQAGN